MLPATDVQRVLILGASGYIGQRLVTYLVASGHRITAAARRIEWLKKQHWPDVKCVFADLLKPHTLAPLLTDIDTVYYLVHSMGDGDDLVERERRAAGNLRDALKKSQVKQVIFLGALQPSKNNDGGSPHLKARAITGNCLRESGIPITELRAGIIVGAGSAAFEVMRDMVYNLPILTPPRWVRSRTSPIALDNLLYYLEQLMYHRTDVCRFYEAAGPQVLSYQQQFERFMALSGRSRLLIPVPFPTRWISVWFLTLITSVPGAIAKALIQGLNHDLVADNGPLCALIPQRLMTFDQAVLQTLNEEKKLVDSPEWGYDPQAYARWRPEYGYYPKQAGHRITTEVTSAALWEVINSIGGAKGYFFANILWKIRGMLDLLVGHRLAKGRPKRRWLRCGDKIDSWKVIRVEDKRELALLFGMKAPGLGRLCFTIADNGVERTLDVRAFWHPHGTPGLFYWLIMIPAHLFIFRGMARRIIQLAAQINGKTSS